MLGLIVGFLNKNDTAICKAISKLYICDVKTIYMIISPSGKKYVGKTVNMKSRMYSYKSGYCKSQVKLHASFAKYGFDQHKVEIIWQGACSDDELSIIEIFWILAKGTYANGMNLTKGGEGSSGRKLSDAHKAAISARRKGQKGSENQKEAVRIILRERNPMRLEASRRKVSEARKGMTFSVEHKRKLLAKLNTEEARYKAAQSKRGKRMGAENHNSKAVLQMKDGIVICRHDSAASASRATGIQRVNITKCCIGERSIAGGFNWLYDGQDKTN